MAAIYFKDFRLSKLVGNGPLEIAKRSALADHPLFVVEGEITEIEQWSEAEDEARGKELLDVVRGRWPSVNDPS